MLIERGVPIAEPGKRDIANPEGVRDMGARPDCDDGGGMVRLRWVAQQSL